MPDQPPTAAQMVFTCGVPSDAASQLGDATADVTPGDATIASADAAFDAADVSPADTRSKVLFATVDGQPDRALVSFASVVGFAGRLVDLRVGPKFLQTERLFENLSAQLSRIPTPEDRPARAVVVVGDQPVPEQLADQWVVRVPESGKLLDGLEPATFVNLRAARRLTVVANADLMRTLTVLATLSALRSKRGNVRLGDVVLPGLEPADLEEVRQHFAERRRNARNYTAVTVDVEEPTERQQRLQAAAAVPAVDTMALLGARYNADAQAWHCPRPERHTNGDATPSMMADDDGRIRCFRCDAEPADALLLTVDTLDVSADEAADLLLDHPRWGAELLTSRRGDVPQLAGTDEVPLPETFPSLDEEPDDPLAA